MIPVEFKLFGIAIEAVCWLGSAAVIVAMIILIRKIRRERKEKKRIDDLK